MDEEDFQFKHVSKDDFDRTYKKIIRGRQKQKDDQQWNNYMESMKETDPTNLNPIKNASEIKDEKDLISKCTKIQLKSHDSVNVLSLYNPNDRNHLHGLRSRLFITFNEFSTIVKNELLPPVLKSTKKVQIKCGQQTDMDYITDLNSLFSEVKEKSKNENVFKKLNKTNALLKATFQMKLIQCYKLSIDAIKLCSITLKAGVYNAIQRRMKKLIQIISALSLTTRKYLFGELFKKKKEESFDLVQHCKVLLSMLDEYGFEDIENNDYSSVHGYSLLHPLSMKAMTKPRVPLFGANCNRLSMYKEAKPVYGSKYAREWSKKQQLSKNNSKDDGLLCEETENMSPHSNQNIKTAIEEYSSFNDQTIILNKTDSESLFEDKGNVCHIYNDEKKTQTLASETLHITKLKTANNVGFYIIKDDRSLVDTVEIEPETIKEKPWMNVPITDSNISPEERLPLGIRPEEANNFDLYAKQFGESKRSNTEMDMTFNVTESIKDNEILTKAIDGVIKMLIMSELRYSF